jgi:hypothetical protein
VADQQWLSDQHWHAWSTLNVCSTLACLTNTACWTQVWLINKQNITTFNYHYKLKHCIHTINFNRSLCQKCSTLHFQLTGYGLFHLWPIYALHMTKLHHNTQTSFQYHLINL